MTASVPPPAVTSTPAAETTGPRIAIIGAGPAGCMLARLLLHHPNPNPNPSDRHPLPKPTVTIFESDASPNYRSQGGTLDLHTSTGLAALKEAGLYDQFLSKARYDGQHMEMTDKGLNTYFKINPTPARPPGPSKQQKTGEKRGSGFSDQRPEIDRADLRQILTESLPEGTIRWGCRVKEISRDGKTFLFADGRIENMGAEFDLIVGADGAWSKVRSCLLLPAGSPDPVQFSGTGGYELSIPAPASETSPAVSRLVNGGNIFVCAPGVRLVFQQLSDGSIDVHPHLVKEEADWYTTPEKCGHDAWDLGQVKKYLLEGPDAPFAKEKGWHPLLRKGIQDTGGKCTPRSLYQLPIGFRWEHRPGVTLIGDAAHLMTPSAGEGVNVALEDSMVLAREIHAAISRSNQREHGRKEGRPDWKEVFAPATKAYELEMWPRSARVAQLSHDMTRGWLFQHPREHTAVTTARNIATIINFHAPQVLHPVVTALVYTYFLLRYLVMVARLKPEWLGSRRERAGVTVR